MHCLSFKGGQCFFYAKGEKTDEMLYENAGNKRRCPKACPYRHDVLCRWFCMTEILKEHRENRMKREKKDGGKIR